MRDPYDVLGLGRSASEAEVKRAYRKLAKENHPDRRRDDPKAQAKFSAICFAYEILGDKDKRAQFDRGEIDGDGKPRFQGFEGFRGGAGGQAGFENIDPRAFADMFSGLGARGAGGGTRSFRFSSGAGGTRTFETGGGGGNDDILSSILGSMGGRGRTGSAGAPGADVRAEAAVTLEDIAAGKKAKVTLPSGKNVAMTLPKGVTDGQVIRLPGQGGASLSGGAPGDALVTIRFVPHPLFKPEGAGFAARSAGEPRRGGARRQDRGPHSVRQGARDRAPALQQRPRPQAEGQGAAFRKRQRRSAGDATYRPARRPRWRTGGADAPLARRGPVEPARTGFRLSPGHT